jgi:glycosyltransferase involved in cell wall biosynthesis
MKKRYGKHFIEKYYTRADKAVFQTVEAKAVYPKHVADKGLVIENPIKRDLPESYHGERNKVITTFCRISEQKNLPVMIDAFAKLYKEYPEYTLRIIGDAPNEEGVRVRNQIVEQMKRLGIESAVEMVPFMDRVHEAIINDAMYVNSSDYEGMSNAMLEAMAIGMPVVCTDCPIGGAHAAIQHGENGLLVPVKDSQALYMAMKQIVEDEEFSKKLSENAAKIREKLSLENIANQWMELL